MVSFFSDPFIFFLDLNFYWSVIVFLDFVHTRWYLFEGILIKIETFLDLFLGFLFDFLVWFLFLFIFLMKFVSFHVFILSDQCFMRSIMLLCHVFVCGWFVWFFRNEYFQLWLEIWFVFVVWFILKDWFLEMNFSCMFGFVIANNSIWNLWLWKIYVIMK